MIDNGYIQVGKYRLEARWYGPGPQQAPTLVFLHEGLGCMELWKDFPAALAEATGCGALVYSRLGYGKSDSVHYPRPVDFMHREGLEMVPELLKAAGIQSSILIGHSDGGSIGIIYAGGTPALPLKGLITEAAHVFCERITVKSIEEAKDSYENSDLRDRLKRYHGANTDCAFYGWNGAWLNPDFMQWNIEEYLPGIAVPVLAIQGRDDQYGTAGQVEAIKKGAGKGAEILMVNNCGHTPHKDQTKVVFNAMKQFIAGIFP